MQAIIEGKWVLCLLMVPLVAATASCTSELPPPVSVAPLKKVAYEGPAVSDFAIWRPYFTVGDQVIDSDRVIATAFALGRGAEDSPILVTSLHRAIGADAPIDDSSGASNFLGTFRDIMISEAFGAGDELRQAGFPLIPDPSGRVESAAGSSSLAHDVLLFAAGASRRRLRPLSLDLQPLEVGKRIWLATAVYGGASPSTVGHEAVLTGCEDDGSWTYQFTNENLSLQATWGAPLLNREGDVVGMHLGTDSSLQVVNGIGVSSVVLNRLLEQLAVSSAAEASSAAGTP
ncbi:MAG: hypothetical protein AAGJ83_15525 [Planctomycetota bacterium]